MLVGVDINDVEKMRRAVSRRGDAFLKRVFTEREISYCYSRRNPFPHLAARFSAKEAVLKALQVDWSEGIRWKDVEIVSQNGQPKVEIRGELRRCIEEKRLGKIRISLSHSGRYSIAIALVEEQ